VVETVQEVKRVKSTDVQAQKIRGSQDVRAMKDPEQIKKEIRDLESKEQLTEIQKRKLAMLKSSLTEIEVDVVVERQVATQQRVTEKKVTEELDLTYRHAVQGKSERDNAATVFNELVAAMQADFDELVKDTLKKDIDHPEKNVILLKKLNDNKKDHHSLRMRALILKNIYSTPRLMNGLIGDQDVTTRRRGLLEQVLKLIDSNDLNYPFLNNTAPVKKL